MIPAAALALGFALSFALLWLLVRSPLVRFFADTPDHRKVHQNVVPRFGGLALVLGSLMLLVASRAMPVSVLGPGFSTSLVFICLFLLGSGTLDDVHPVGFKMKFLLQFVLAGILVLVLGNHFDAVNVFGRVVDLGGAGPLLSMFWFVALMNAFNIIDGIDGLAGGVALCGLAAVGLLAYSNHSPELLWCALAVAGLVAGFLPFNFHPRTKVFLGDTGSQFLGACMALLTIKAQGLPSVGHSLLIPMLVVGYPLFDVSVAMTRRFLRCGRRSFSNRFTRMFLADNEHMHHRLVYMGLSHLQSSALLLVLAGSLSASAFILARAGGRGEAFVLAYLGLAMLLVLDRLGYLGAKRRLTARRSKPSTQRIVGVITGSDLFLHSLNKYPQASFDFLHLPNNLTHFMGPDLSAVVLYNGRPERFEEQWTALLRMREFGEFPAIVIAGPAEIAKVRHHNPADYSRIRFLEKPGRIPEVIRELEVATRPATKAVRRAAARDARFSLAEIAMRARDGR